MTILVVDAGNTRIKWAILAQGVLDNAAQAERPTPGKTPRCDEHGDAPEPPHPADQFQTFVAQHWMPLARPARVVVANVAGADFGAALATWVKQTWDIEAEFVVPQRNAYGIHNAYLDPQKLGVDRWAGMIAAHRSVKGAACVIGCGTAITLDVLTASGEHQGGLIVPGLTLMRHALLENTQGIHSNMGDESGETAILARDTQGGVNGGTLYTVISVIDRVTTDLAAELGTGMTRVITGGDAPALLPLLAGHYRHEPLLVLQGLAIIAQAAQEPPHPDTTVAPGILPPATLVHPCTTVASGIVPSATLVHPCTTVASGILPPATLVHPCTTENAP